MSERFSIQGYDNPRGIMYMLLAMFLFAAGDAIAKHLTSLFHPVQIIWFRQIGLFIGVAIVVLIKGRAVLLTANPRLQILRGVLAIGSSILFVYAIRYAPLAEAVAASFVAPFFLILLGAWVLNEIVSMKQWIAVIVGFLGTLIIIRPGMDGFHPALLLVVLAAAFFSCRQMISRLLARSDSVVTTVAYTAITTTLITTIPLMAVWKFPENSVEVSLLAGLAVTASIGEVLIIKSLAIAEANRVAPVHYTLIVWGSLYGYLFFGHMPDTWTYLGTAIVIAAGLFTLQDERRVRTGK